MIEKKWIIILGIVFLLISGTLAFVFWAKPAAEKYILDKQQEAYTVGLVYAQNFMLSEIAKSLTEKGYVQVTFPNNQSIVLVPGVAK